LSQIIPKKQVGETLATFSLKGIDFAATGATDVATQDVQVIAKAKQPTRSFFFIIK